MYCSAAANTRKAYKSALFKIRLVYHMSSVWTVEIIHDIQYVAHLSLKGRCHSAVAVHLSAIKREYKTPRCS